MDTDLTLEFDTCALNCPRLPQRLFVCMCHAIELTNIPKCTCLSPKISTNRLPRICHLNWEKGNRKWMGAVDTLNRNGGGAVIQFAKDSKCEHWKCSFKWHFRMVKTSKYQWFRFINVNAQETVFMVICMFRTQIMVLLESHHLSKPKPFKR